MKRRSLLAGACALGGVTLVSTVASAAPPVRLPANIDMNEIVEAPRINGTGLERVPRRVAISRLDANATMRTASGRVLTMQQYLDSLIALEGRTGKSLRMMPARQPLDAASAARLAAQQATHDADETRLRDAQARAWSAAPPTDRHVGINGLPGTLVPASPPDSASWHADFGDHQYLGGYSSFDFTDTGAITGVTCHADFDAGVWLFGHQEDLLHATLDVASSDTGNSSRLTVNIPGVDPISRTIDSTNPFAVLKSFDTTKYTASYPLIPGLSANLSFWGSAVLSVRATATGAPIPGATHACSATIDPEVAAVGHAAAYIAIGIPEVVDLVTGGVRADLSLVKIGIPTTGALSLSTTPPPSLTDSLSSSLNASFMDGDVVVFINIDNPWHILDLLGIQSHYEWTITNWTGANYQDQLFNVTGRKTGFVSRPTAVDNHL